MSYLKDVTSFYQDQDTYVFWPISISVLLALGVISVWAVYYFALPKQLPIFYSLPWGDSQFGHINQFILFSIINLADNIN